MDGNVQLVALPEGVDPKQVKQVLLLNDYFRFGMDYENKRKHDIVFFKLANLPVGVDRTKVLVWDTFRDGQP